MFGIRQVAYLCGNKLIVNIDDELLLLVHDNANNRFIDVTKLDNDINEKCKEVSVDINEVYTTKYFPRVYYTIYKLEIGGRSGYLLERYNGTSASSRFYPCNDFKTCGDYIETLEGL